jgi:two-component system, cell cycle sensor histidine kinase and response regulator CckA
MPNTKVEAQLRLANVELSRRIALLEKKLAETERTKKNQQGIASHYQPVFESARDGILIVNAETGEVIEVNPTLLQLLGYSQDELCGRYIWEIVPLKKIIQTKDAFSLLRENQFTRYEDVSLETCEGLGITVAFVATTYFAGQEQFVVCSLQDITAITLAESEHKRLLTAIEQANEGIVMTDTRGNINFVNPSYEQTTGYNRKELLGRNPRILNSATHNDLFFHQLWDTLSRRRVWKGQITNKRKDGTLYTAETTICPVCDASGRIVSYVAVQHEITEHPQAAAEKQQPLKKEAVGLLAEGISHQYNNLLSVIIGYTELALEKVTPSQSLHADLEVILKAAKRSADVTRQLLAFARQQMITPQVFELNQCIENMLPMLRQFIGDAVQLSWRPKGEPLYIQMDPIQIGQILTNLCTNAREAISGAGKITVETEKACFDQSLSAHQARDSADVYVLLAVSDDGCGMEKELVDKIFEPFFTHKRVGKGTGLGLSMVHSIVQQNNGFINVYSEQGIGTTFRLYLPRHISHTDLPPDENPTEIPRGCGEMVLVVDDELYLLTIAERLLEKLGYRVLTAGTTDKAIELTRAYCNEIRLLITDIIMPEMNGRGLAERLQSLCPDMNVLFMSGYTAGMIIDQGLLEKDVNFIQKPFLVNDLAVKIRTALKTN